MLLTIGERECDLAGDPLERGRGHHLIDQTGTPGPSRIELTAGEHEIERVGQPDQTRQPLRATGARKHTQLHFRQTEACPGIVSRDAVGTGKRHLEPATEGDAVDGRDYGNAKPLQATK